MRTAYSYLVLPLAALYGPVVAAAETPQATQATQAAQAQASPAPGLTVARDPVTGKLRAPTAAERQALLRQAQAGVTARPAPAAVTGKHGERSVHLGERNLVYSVVRRGADGRLDHHCVDGSQAAGQILDRPAATHGNAPGDDHHAHR